MTRTWIFILKNGFILDIFKKELLFGSLNVVIMSSVTVTSVFLQVPSAPVKTCIRFSMEQFASSSLANNSALRK